MLKLFSYLIFLDFCNHPFICVKVKRPAPFFRLAAFWEKFVKIFGCRLFFNCFCMQPYLHNVADDVGQFTYMVVPSALTFFHPRWAFKIQIVISFL